MGWVDVCGYVCVLLLLRRRLRLLICVRPSRMDVGCCRIQVKRRSCNEGSTLLMRSRATFGTMPLGRAWS